MVNAVSPLPGRRRFLRWLTGLLGAAAAALVGVPFLGYLFGARGRPVRWVPLGPVADFTRNQQMRRVAFDNLLRQPWDGVVARTEVFVRYLGRDSKGQDDFLVLAVNCAHLGCPVSWFPQSGLFLCPCHGGVYYANGKRASGPPPRDLFKCVWEVRDDGQLWVQAPHYPTLRDTLDPNDHGAE